MASDQSSTAWTIPCPVAVLHFHVWNLNNEIVIMAECGRWGFKIFSKYSALFKSSFFFAFSIHRRPLPLRSERNLKLLRRRQYWKNQTPRQESGTYLQGPCWFHHESYFISGLCWGLCCATENWRGCCKEDQEEQGMNLQYLLDDGDAWLFMMFECMQAYCNYNVAS